MTRYKAWNFALLTFSAVAIAASPVARADIQVTSSTSPGLRTGTTLPDNAELDVGKGEAVQVLMSGKTYSIAGPYKGTVAGYQPCTGWRAVFGKCEQQSGDTEGGYTPGATRSFRIDNDTSGTPTGDHR